MPLPAAEGELAPLLDRATVRTVLKIPAGIGRQLSAGHTAAFQLISGIAIKDIGLAALWPSIAAQSALALGFLTIAAGRFRKTLS